MPKNDWIRLRHMLDAAREAMKSASGRTRKDLDTDYVWTLGLVKCVEIIGEAAARMGEETKERNPQIPWAQIIAMRNRLVHLYFDIDLDQVWSGSRKTCRPLSPNCKKYSRGTRRSDEPHLLKGVFTAVSRHRAPPG